MQTQIVRGGMPGARRYDVDWLRVMAIIVIFFFHCTRPFDNYMSWHIKNNQLTGAFTLPALIGSLLMMPLFFVLSGEATYFSLRSRGAGSFVRTRLLCFLFGMPLLPRERAVARPAVQA